MKVSAAIYSAVVVMAPLVVSAQRPMSKNGVRSLLANARRLDGEDAGDDKGEMGERAVEDYIQDYSLQFLQCVGDEAIQDVDENGGNGNGGYNGSNQYGVVFFRLCPNAYCSASGECKEGYSDFAISIASYVYAYLDDQAENMQWDDQMNMDNLASCTQYNAQNGDGNSYYVGPTCTSDGRGIKLGLFSDYSCQYKSDVSFESISNGLTLPYSNGGLVSTSCVACAEYNENGNYEVKDLCMNLYDAAPLKCESWNMMHYYWDAMTEIYRYGADRTGCKKMNRLTAQQAPPVSEVGSFIMLFILVSISIGGGAYYMHWWDKKKKTLEKIDDEEEDGEGEGDEYHRQEDTEDKKAGTFA